MSLNGRLSVSSTRTVKRARKTKVEYLLTFCGYGPEHNVWQEDVENCEQLVKDCWASKPASERLVVALFPPTVHMEGISMSFCLPVPPMLHAIIAQLLLPLCGQDGRLLQLFSLSLSTLSGNRDSRKLSTACNDILLCICVKGATANIALYFLAHCFEGVTIVRIR